MGCNLSLYALLDIYDPLIVLQIKLKAVAAFLLGEEDECTLKIYSWKKCAL